jgi:hypothetical protein
MYQENILLPDGPAPPELLGMQFQRCKKRRFEPAGQQ